jgi:hypothetical protein
MEIEAFLADAVQASGGKLHALGIGWQVIQTTAFPARHDRVGIGLIVRTVAAEAGQHTLTLTLLDPEGARRPRGLLHLTQRSRDGDARTQPRWSGLRDGGRAHVRPGDRRSGADAPAVPRPDHTGTAGHGTPDRRVPLAGEPFRRPDPSKHHLIPPADPAG